MMDSKKFLILFFLIFGWPLQLKADSSDIKTELKRQLEAVNQACGLNVGQTPNRSPDCIKARQLMQNYHTQHASDIAALKKEQDKQILKQIQAEYERSCLKDSSTFDCKHKQTVIEQGRQKGLLE